MAAPVLKNASDSYVSEKYPSKNYSSVSKLYLADGSSSDTRYGYIYFGVPSGMFGAQIQSAKVRIYSGSGFSGSVTMSLQRVAAKYTNSQINYTNKPGVTGSAVSVTKSSAASGTMWEFDVTAVMQAVANGSPFYGFRLSATNSTAKWVYSANADDKYRPVLVIQWTDAPHAPSTLIPDNGEAISVAKPTLQWDFTDPNGDTSMQAFNLRLFSSLANAQANSSAIGDYTIASDNPQVDLDDTAYAGLAADATLWWRVRVQDGAGLWSNWSDYAYFVRTSKGTLTITNPSSGTPIVYDSTPPLSWTFTGRTQRAYEVLISTPEEPATYLWRSGRVTSTDTAVTPPKGVISELGKTYRLEIRIFDTVLRRYTPDDPNYQVATRDFTYQQSGTVASVTSYSGSVDAFRPRWVQQWQRATAPDYFVIYRDGKVIDTVEPSEVFVSGITYRYTDKDASARKDHTWSVAAKVNGVTSSGNPTSTGQVKLVTTVLSDLDGTDELFLFNPDVQAAKAESSEVHYLLGNAPPVLITQNLRGYEGTITGVLADSLVSGLTIAAQLASLEKFRQNPGRVLRLQWVEKNLRVVIYGLTETTIPYPDGTLDHLVSFNFFQTDF